MKKTYNTPSISIKHIVARPMLDSGSYFKATCNNAQGEGDSDLAKRQGDNVWTGNRGW